MPTVRASASTPSSASSPTGAMPRVSEDVPSSTPLPSIPTRVTPRMQLIIQKNVIGRLLTETGPLQPPLPLRIISEWPLLRRLPARFVGLGVRPEHVRVSTIQSNHWTPVTVYVTELMGSETFVILELGSQKIIARTPGGFYVDGGRSAWISFDLSKALLFDSETGLRL